MGTIHDFPPARASQSARLHRMLTKVLASSNREAKRAVTLIITAAYKTILKLKTGVK